MYLFWTPKWMKIFKHASRSHQHIPGLPHAWGWKCTSPPATNTLNHHLRLPATTKRFSVFLSSPLLSNPFPCPADPPLNKNTTHAARPQPQPNTHPSAIGIPPASAPPPNPSSTVQSIPFIFSFPVPFSFFSHAAIDARRIVFWKP